MYSDSLYSTPPTQRVHTYTGTNHKCHTLNKPLQAGLTPQAGWSANECGRVDMSVNVLDPSIGTCTGKQGVFCSIGITHPILRLIIPMPHKLIVTTSSVIVAMLVVRSWGDGGLGWGHRCRRRGCVRYRRPQLLSELPLAGRDVDVVPRRAHPFESCPQICSSACCCVNDLLMS